MKAQYKILLIEESGKNNVMFIPVVPRTGDRVLMADKQIKTVSRVLLCPDNSDDFKGMALDAVCTVEI